jgi:hypothetical protein
MPTSILITAADANFFELVRGTLLSIREKPLGRKAALGFFDLGCTAEQLQWLRNHVDFIEQPEWEFEFPGRDQAQEHLKGLLARPFLRKYFPDFELYFWIDADAWVQDWSAVELFLQGAQLRGAALVPEIDRGYLVQYGGLPEWWGHVYNFYEPVFGADIARKLSSYPLLNAGVFSLHQDAPHWLEWAEYIRMGVQRSHTTMTDQMALNVALYGRGLLDKTELLPAWCNWTCHFGLPIWDKRDRRLVEPHLPHTPIGILHLTHKKHDRVRLPTTDGDVVDVSLRYPAAAEPLAANQPPTVPGPFSAGDYVSPGLAVIRADRYFPHMIIGDKQKCSWRYLRRDIFHNWYVDRRMPSIGFLNRDEVHLLYNIALGFRGKRALEIGCWLGWSACHLALAGLQLDVVDPVLAQSEFRESVTGSLQAAGVLDLVHLIAGHSPEKVQEVGEQLQGRWSMIFIDGDHDAPGPLHDAIACERFADLDAAIVFHDLASPEVTQGLDHLRGRGWNTRVYQTMQIMGVAWRGNFTPPRHIPDPRVKWVLPGHLRDYQVSGT